MSKANFTAGSTPLQQLNVRIVEELFKWKAVHQDTGAYWLVPPHWKTTGMKEGKVGKLDYLSSKMPGFPEILSYSAKMDCAWLIVEKMKDMEYQYTGAYYEKAWCCFKRDHIAGRISFGQYAPKMPEAICLAALEAIHEQSALEKGWYVGPEADSFA